MTNDEWQDTRVKNKKQLRLLRHTWRPNGGLNLNIGCREDIRPGWENLDLFPLPGATKFDITKPWPYAATSVDNILTNHVLEHVSRDKMRAVLAEGARALKPGGRWYIGVPHAANARASYGTMDHYGGFHQDAFRDSELPPPLRNSLNLVVRRLQYLGFDSWYHPAKYFQTMPNWGRPYYLVTILTKVE